MINTKYYPAMVRGKSLGPGMHCALFLATLCYLYILFFALSGLEPNSERHKPRVWEAGPIIGMLPRRNH